MTTLIFGALAPPIHEQLGLARPTAGSPADHWQRDADAISRLAVRGLLADSESLRARRRLLKRMERDARGALP